jgi:DNA-binding transcriptional LysR family regulator
MDSVQGMRVFARVAQLGGFSTAARDLRLSAAAVTKHVAALEDRVGARLLNRTTRAVSLTEAGRVYLERCLECLQAFDDAEASVGELAGEPRGVLRLTAPVEFGNMHLPPLVAHFIKHHPRVTIDLRLSNRMLDLVDESIDLALRFAATSLEGGFVARPFATTRAALWASPDYLRAHGRPRRPEDLARHRFLVFSEPEPRDELPFSRGKETVRLKLNAAMLSNSGEMLMEAACQGAGVILAPSMLAVRAWRAGRIEPILLDWTVFSGRMFACYPNRRHLSPKVRAVLDFLRATYGDDPSRDPWWPEPPAARRRSVAP